MHVDVQRQMGGSDCAVIAMAFATAICMRQDPHTIAYAQVYLRSHLEQVFETEHVSMFPQSDHPRRLGRRRIIHKGTVNVFCVCRSPWNKNDNEKGPLVLCQLCKEWYHQLCMNISREVIDSPPFKFNCKLCLDLSL